MHQWHAPEIVKFKGNHVMGTASHLGRAELVVSLGFRPRPRKFFHMEASPLKPQYICMYIYIYIHMYVCMYVCMYVYIYIYMVILLIS